MLKPKTKKNELHHLILSSPWEPQSIEQKLLVVLKFLNTQLC